MYAGERHGPARCVVPVGRGLRICRDTRAELLSVQRAVADAEPVNSTASHQQLAELLTAWALSANHRRYSTFGCHCPLRRLASRSEYVAQCVGGRTHPKNSVRSKSKGQRQALPRPRHGGTLGR
jgi:hypothetical protein